MSTERFTTFNNHFQNYVSIHLNVSIETFERTRRRLQMVNFVYSYYYLNCYFIWIIWLYSRTIIVLHFETILLTDARLSIQNVTINEMKMLNYLGDILIRSYVLLSYNDHSGLCRFFFTHLLFFTVTAKFRILYTFAC